MVVDRADPPHHADHGRPEIARLRQAVRRHGYQADFLRKHGSADGQVGVKTPAPPAPKREATLVWLSPASGQAGSTVQLSLSGADFAPEATVAIGGAGVEISKVKVESTSRITATLRIAVGTASGVRGVTVSTPSGTSNAANFRINARRPKG